MNKLVTACELHLGVFVRQEDRERLLPHLVGYNHLNEILLMNGIPPEDVKRMILLEVETHNRPTIIRRLVGTLLSKERRKLLEIIQCVNPNSKLASSNTRSAKAASRSSGRRRRSGGSRTAS